MIGTGAEVVRYLVQAVGSLYLVIVLLRLLLQLARADFSTTYLNSSSKPPIPCCDLCAA